MKTELLSPAGDLEAGYAAFFYGADAIYLGLKQFSARATATNFDENDLAQITGYAHFLGKKVYVTINTILQEDELPDVLTSLDLCAKHHVDAIIVQDFGVARIIKERYPNLQLHASTQMAVHNKDGAIALKKMGFSRVVLARELSLNEIKDIATIPDLEIEVFIHGALCYSYSGLCLFSSFEDGRSANRGKCAYPCRACFGADKHLFSMKDLALQTEVLKLPNVSLKIEGRKKNALYVAAVTNYYRHILDDKADNSKFEQDIKQIFSRPWTKLHFLGKNKQVIDTEFVGHRGLIIGKIDTVFKGKVSFKTAHSLMKFDGIQIDVDGIEKPFGFSIQDMTVRGKKTFLSNAGDVVCISLPPDAPFLKKGQNIYLASSSGVKGAYNFDKPKPNAFKTQKSVDICVELDDNKITASCLNASVSMDILLSPANDAIKVEQAIKNAFLKCKEMDFKPEKISIINPKNLFVPASVLNNLRRELYAKIEIIDKKTMMPEISKAVPASKAKWIVKIQNIAQLDLVDLSLIDEIVVLMSEEISLSDLKKLPKNKVRLSLPTIARQTLFYKKQISDFINQGYKKWEINNWWGLTLLDRSGIDLSFGSDIYICNLQAIEHAKQNKASYVTLSCEDTLINWKKLADKTPLPVCLTVYRNIPLFTSYNCVRSYDCKNCLKGEALTEIKKDGRLYYVHSKKCHTTVYANTPMSLSCLYKEVPAHFYGIDLTGLEMTAEQSKQIISDVMAQKNIKNSVTFNAKKMI